MKDALLATYFPPSRRPMGVQRTLRSVSLRYTPAERGGGCAHPHVRLLAPLASAEHAYGAVQAACLAPLRCADRRPGGSSAAPLALAVKRRGGDWRSRLFALAPAQAHDAQVCTAPRREFARPPGRHRQRPGWQALAKMLD